jgi:hypothetical protein
MITFPSAGEEMAPSAFSTTLSGSLKKKQMNRVRQRPINVKTEKPLMASINVERAAASINGIPGLAMGKAVNMGFSGQE